jgi:hypothetical protein
MIIKSAGALNHNVIEQYRLENWLWYSDPGPVPLQKKHALPIDEVNKILPYYKRCKYEREFNGYTLRMDVRDMVEGCLYVPKNYDSSVVEWLMVDHTKKRVYGHQVTNRIMRDHVFKLSVVDRLLYDLHMLHTEEAKEYKLVIIGVNDFSIQNPTGMSFSRKKTGHGRAYHNRGIQHWQMILKERNDKVIVLTLHYLIILIYTQLAACEAKKKKCSTGSKFIWENANRVETILARVNVFQSPPFELPDDTNIVEEK